MNRQSKLDGTRFVGDGVNARLLKSSVKDVTDDEGELVTVGVDDPCELDSNQVSEGSEPSSGSSVSGSSGSSPDSKTSASRCDAVDCPVALYYYRHCSG